jgi:glycine cleavage system H protein
MRTVECVRSESDIYAPVSGEVYAVNGNVETTPGKICQHAYQARISGLKLALKPELTSLPDAERYQERIEAHAR